MQDHLLGYVMDGKFWHEFPQNNLVFRLENPKDILQQLDKIVKQRYDGSNSSSHTIFPTSDFNQSYAQQGKFYTDDPYNNNNNNNNNNTIVQTNKSFAVLIANVAPEYKHITSTTSTLQFAQELSSSSSSSTSY
eukprot:UN03796